MRYDAEAPIDMTLMHSCYAPKINVSPKQSQPIYVKATNNRAFNTENNKIGKNSAPTHEKPTIAQYEY